MVSRTWPGGVFPVCLLPKFRNRPLALRSWSFPTLFARLLLALKARAFALACWLALTVPAGTSPSLPPLLLLLPLLLIPRPELSSSSFPLSLSLDCFAPIAARCHSYSYSLRSKGEATAGSRSQCL